MSHDDDNDPLRQLEAALSVKPSPDFAARVRERVRQEPQQTMATSWGWWSLAAASVVMALIGVASMTMWRKDGQSRVAIVADAVPNGGPGLQARPTEVAAAIAKAGAEDPALHREQSTPHPVVTHVAARAHEPEVLVPPDEGIAIRRLLLAIRQGRATVPAPGLRVMEDEDGHLLDPTPIDIPLIKIEPLPGTPVIGSGGIVK